MVLLNKNDPNNTVMLDLCYVKMFGNSCDFLFQQCMLVKVLRTIAFYLNYYIFSRLEKNTN